MDGERGKIVAKLKKKKWSNGKRKKAVLALWKGKEEIFSYHRKRKQDQCIVI